MKARLTCSQTQKPCLLNHGLNLAIFRGTEPRRVELRYKRNFFIVNRTLTLVGHSSFGSSFQRRRVAPQWLERLQQVCSTFHRLFSDFPSVNAVLRLWQLMLSAMVREPFRLLCYMPSFVFTFHICNQSQSPVNMDYLSEMSVNPNSSNNCVPLELLF